MKLINIPNQINSINNKYINELDFEIDFVQALDDEFMR